MPNLPTLICVSECPQTENNFCTTDCSPVDRCTPDERYSPDDKCRPS